MAAGEIATLIGEAGPYMTAALSAYGAAVLSKVRDDAADATVSAGRKLLQRIFGIRKDEEPLPVVLADALEEPADAPAVLRGEIRRRLEADPTMLADFQEILRSVSVQTTVHAPVIQSGRDTYYSGRDINIGRRAD